MTKIYAKNIYDGKGNILKNKTLVIEKNTINKIIAGKDSPDYEVEVITPAFIDAHSHIGLDRHGEGFMEDDTNEKEDSIITFADTLDGIQMDDKNFRLSVESGVLYSCILHGSGNIIGSKAVVVRNFEDNTNSAFVKYAGYKAALGYNPKSTEDWKGSRFSTRIGILAHLRKKLLKAKMELRLIEKGKKEEEELELEELFFINLLKKREYLRVHLHRHDDMYALLRLKDEFGFDFVLEHTSDFHSLEPYLEIKKRGIPIVYGPLDSFAYKPELKNEDWRNIKYLLDSGVKFGLMTDHPVIMQNMLFYTLRWFLRFGVKKEEAITYITSKNAEILGLHNLGSIQTGKLASFILWNGDPFDLHSYPVGVVKEGIMEKFD